MTYFVEDVSAIKRCDGNSPVEISLKPNHIPLYHLVSCDSFVRSQQETHQFPRNSTPHIYICMFMLRYRKSYVELPT